MLLGLVVGARLAVPVVPAWLVGALAAGTAVTLRKIIILAACPLRARLEFAPLAVVLLVVIALEVVRVEPAGCVGARHGAERGERWEVEVVEGCVLAWVQAALG
eukprot:scaffold25307_cov47-Tisochrysis_lutea.AAC.4